MTDNKNQSFSHTIKELKSLIGQLQKPEQKSYQRWLNKIERRRKQKLPISIALKKFQTSLQQQLETIQYKKANLPAINFPELLPISAHVDELSRAINENQVVIVAGETGSGKTTQLPKICLAMGRGIHGQIGHTQPRRLAARTVASRIAEELGVELGKQVGYQVRFDDRSDARSYIKLMTDGILLNELHHDPLLKKYDTLIIDEAHERSLNIDFILGILHQVLSKRPELKVIITSATIDPQRFSSHFNNAPMIEVSGRTYPVETLYMPLAADNVDGEDMSVEEGICQAAEQLFSYERGDILVFLPGEQDIRHTADYLRRHIKQNVDILPLYSRLAQSEQMRIFSPGSSGKPRIILSTNVAETSLTVPGIHYVIDSGKARISRYSVRSKIQRLPIESISQASANQRKGRCGRTANGICVRLYSEEDFLSRQEFTDPEIKRTNLASVILQMAMLELGAVEDFDFIEPPDPKVINDGYKLLQELGAMTANRKITPLGKKLAILPVDPKLGRILVAGSEYHSLNEVLIITAAMSLQDPRERPVEKQQQADEMHRRFLDQDSDFIAILNLWNYFGEQKQTMSWNQLRKVCQKEFLNFNRMREWREIYAQLKRLMLEQKYHLNTSHADYDAIHQALLAGLLSQIGEKTIEGDYQSTRQNRFHIFPGSGLFQRNSKKNAPAEEQPEKKQASRSANWLLAGELVETQKLYARQVAKINPAWVEMIAPHILKHQYSEPYWSRKSARAMVKENLSLYGLIIIANRPKSLAAINPQQAHELFIFHAFIENDYITRAKAIVHNRDCLEQVEAMEHRARRRDILVEQDYLESFYSSRIPEKIHNGPAFERWYKKLHPLKQQQLEFSVEDLIRDEAEEIDRDAYPESITINDIELALEYHFEPGAPDDGLHIILPIAYINQFKEEDFQWLVPGMLEAKVIALIRGLPKSLRKNFVPVPDYAKAVIERLKEDRHKASDASLTHLIAKHLKQMSGILITDSDLDQQTLPENLQPLYFLTEMDSGNVIETSRQLALLQTDYAGQALDFLQTKKTHTLYDKFPSKGFEQDHSANHGDSMLSLYSGMSLVGDQVQLNTFDNQSRAESETQQSIQLLLIKDCSRNIREMKKHLPELAKAELYYATLKPSEEIFYQQGFSALYVDLFLLVSNVKIDNRACKLNNIEMYEALKQELLSSLLPEIVEHSNLLLEIFRQAESVRKTLKKLPSPALIELAGKIQHRMESLLYCGFLSNTGWERLHHFPRYLKALAQRFERAELNPQAERERALIWEKWWHKYSDIADTHSGDFSQQQKLLEFRWLLEEFHVSLFAQSLGTKKSVSEKKLSSMLQQF